MVVLFQSFNVTYLKYLLTENNSLLLTGKLSSQSKNVVGVLDELEVEREA